MCTNPKFYLGCSCEGCLNYGKMMLLGWKGNGWASWGKQIGCSALRSRYCAAWDIPRLDVPDSLWRFLCLWWFQSQGECDWFADPLGASMPEPQMTGCNFRELPGIHSSSLTALASKFFLFLTSQCLYVHSASYSSPPCIHLVHGCIILDLFCS